jgi:tetratricopeptide (TPR) repeat protein
MTSSSSSPDLEALRLMRSGHYADALHFARLAVAASRGCSPAHGLLATILMHLGQREEAEAVVSAGLDRGPGTADAYDALAFVLLQLGSYERANTLYRRAAALGGGSARFWYNLASSERSFGRLQNAEEACDRAITLDSQHYQSYLLRSELRKQSDDNNHVTEMERMLAHPKATDRAHMFLGYALGKELDDLGRHSEAFRWFSQAAAVRRRSLIYDVAADERKLTRIAESFPLGDRAARADYPGSTCFVFILGLPRSGTTLLERILSRLPRVRSNGETENFSRALFAEAPSNDGDVFSRAAMANFNRVGQHYAKLAGCTAEGKVIDKLPLNYLYLGAIQQALPGSTPILVTREPVDSCFAMYRTLFGEAYPFTYDFSDLARYFAAYRRLVEHWRRSLGDWLVDIAYEDLVKQPARVGAYSANACGLIWDESAVEIHRSAGVSMTASAAQIRQPIYQSSAGKWRHYEQYLAPLIAALRAHGVAVQG